MKIKVSMWKSLSKMQQLKLLEIVADQNWMGRGIKLKASNPAA